MCARVLCGCVKLWETPASRQAAGLDQCPTHRGTRVPITFWICQSEQVYKFYDFELNIFNRAVRSGRRAGSLIEKMRRGGPPPPPEKSDMQGPTKFAFSLVGPEGPGAQASQAQGKVL